MAAAPAPPVAPESGVPGSRTGGDCPRCGTPAAPLQRYCLECGQKLALPTGSTTTQLSGWRRLALYGGDWAWPVLAALVVAVLVTAAVIALGAGRESAGPAAATVTMPLGSSVATETTEVPAEPVPTLAAPPEDEPPPTLTGPPDAGAARMVEWPAGRDGFTVVLASLPQDGGREPAMQRARDAGQAGLREVGVLDSDEYSSLHPGYYVVFSGVFSTRPRAEASVQAARDGGYGDAYVSPVAR